MLVFRGVVTLQVVETWGNGEPSSTFPGPNRPRLHLPRRGSIAAVEVKPQVVSPTSVPSGQALLRCLASRTEFFKKSHPKITNARFAAMLCIWGETPKTTIVEKSEVVELGPVWLYRN